MKGESVHLRLQPHIMGFVRATARETGKTIPEVVRLLCCREVIWAETGVSPGGCFFSVPDTPTKIDPDPWAEFEQLEFDEFVLNVLNPEVLAKLEVLCTNTKEGN